MLLQVMRHDVSLALGKTGPNVDVMCTDKRFGGRFLTFVQVRAKLPSVQLPIPHTLRRPFALPCTSVALV